MDWYNQKFLFGAVGACDANKYDGSTVSDVSLEKAKAVLA